MRPASRRPRRATDYHRPLIVPDVALQHEAGVVARRIIGRDPTDAERRRYAEALTRIAVPLSPRETRLWRRMLAHPWLYDAVDGALALVQPASGIRQRGYTMLAVLEASTAHTELFLARPRPRVRVLLSVLAAGGVGALRTSLGLIVIAVSR